MTHEGLMQQLDDLGIQICSGCQIQEHCGSCECCNDPDDGDCNGCIYDGATDTHASSVCMGCEDGDCYTPKDGG